MWTTRIPHQVIRSLVALIYADDAFYEKYFSRHQLKMSKSLRRRWDKREKNESLVVFFYPQRLSFNLEIMSYSHDLVPKTSLIAPQSFHPFVNSFSHCVWLFKNHNLPASMKYQKDVAQSSGEESRSQCQENR